MAITIYYRACFVIFRILVSGGIGYLAWRVWTDYVMDPWNAEILRLVGKFNWWTWSQYTQRGYYYSMLFFFFIALCIFLAWSVYAANMEVIRVTSRQRNKVNAEIDRLDKITRELIDVDTRYQRLYSSFGQLTESLLGLAVWVKDINNAYVFSNRALRVLLYNNRPENDLIGKNDWELTSGMCDCAAGNKPLPVKTIDDLPMLKGLSDELACCLTDQIVKQLGRQFLFYEEVKGLCLEVRKAPTYDEYGNLTGTIGVLNDVTAQQDYWRKMIAALEVKGKAFQIDGTQNYLILED